MKVLIVDNIAGVATELKRGLIKNGIQCSIVGPENNFGFEIDHIIKKRFKSRLLNSIFWRLHVPKYILQNDVIHFNSLLFPLFPLDLVLWKVLGKKIIVHRHGTDIRMKKESILVRKFSDKILVSTPDLLEYTPKATWLPNPINLENIECVGSPRNKIVTIVHAPSDKKKKGTKFILKTIEKLKKKHNIRFILVEGMEHEKALEIYKKADIAIDHIGHEWFGYSAYAQFSIEMMAMGKPVAVYIKEKWYPLIPPIINIDERNAYDRIEELINDREERIKIGERSRSYVETVHDHKKIIKQYIGIINEICKKNK